MQRRQLAKIAATSFGGGSLPPHVSILGGRFTLVDGAGNRRPMQTLHMDCVIVDLNEKMTRMFWGPPDENGQLSAYSPDDTRPPACFSDNGVAPSSRALEPQAKTCTPDCTHTSGCKWSVWGSAISKRDGKTKIPACQNGVKTALLVAQVKQAANGGIEAIEVMPLAFMLRIPPNSIDSFKNYGKEIGGYGEVELPWSGQKENLDLPLVVTRVTFVEGEVGKLEFKPIGYINAEINGLIEQLDDKQVDTIVGRDDVPWDGALIETRPLEVKLGVIHQAQLPPVIGSAQASASEPKKSRGRPPKVQQEVVPPGFVTATSKPENPADTVGDIPPFLRRDGGMQNVGASSPNIGTKTQGQTAPFGIQKNAPPPNAELDKMLSDAFGLPTK